MREDESAGTFEYAPFSAETSDLSNGFRSLRTGALIDTQPVRNDAARKIKTVIRFIIFVLWILGLYVSPLHFIIKYASVPQVACCYAEAESSIAFMLVQAEAASC